MAKGTESKKIIFNKLQELFPNSFFEENDKILRVPLNEEGNRVEIKVTLTAAKTNLGGDQPESAFSKPKESNISNFSDFVKTETKVDDIEPTEEEKNNVAKMLASLGL